MRAVRRLTKSLVQMPSSVAELTCTVSLIWHDSLHPCITPFTGPGSQAVWRGPCEGVAERCLRHNPARVYQVCQRLLYLCTKSGWYPAKCTLCPVPRHVLSVSVDANTVQINNKIKPSKFEIFGPPCTSGVKRRTVMGKPRSPIGWNTG